MAISISIDAVTRSHGPVRAVDDLSLEIKAGEFFTLLGSSGSGKSSLLKLIGGFDQPNAGRILFDGQDMASVPANRRPVNTVFQGLGLFPHMSVARNIGYGLKLRGLSGAALEAKVGEALDLVELSGFGERDVNLLSGGQRQRVALARALVMEPGILLLDEPLTGLDERLRQQMRNEFGRLHRRTGATFILVTHNQDEALSLSDRMAIMHQGRIEQLGRPDQFFHAPANAFVARFIGMDNLLRPERLEGSGADTVAIIAGQSVPVTVPDGNVSANLVVIRSDRLVIEPEVGTSAGGAPRQLVLRVVGTTFRGLHRDVTLAFGDGQTLTAICDADAPSLTVGQDVGLSIKPGAALLTSDKGLPLAV
ncbi:ABC transporter ATP-binding protein [Agrobacterium vitis]|uniref:ATP-binding cassette domain-containing protein n=1 Tax=Agrobacterium vitis TaxID=373 RepID=A0A7K1RAR2_AGRVI|nr:ABC transporter ATP-binding protein [Agrobacterium vitis]MVA55215.1 ATP-binding cassette domain-containing protein [Agrobacterium vitis]